MGEVPCSFVLQQREIVMSSDAADKIRTNPALAAAGSPPAPRNAAETAGFATAHAHGKGVPPARTDASHNSAEPASPAIEEVFNRVGAVLERIKSKSESISAVSPPPAHNPASPIQGENEALDPRKVLIETAARATEAKAPQTREKFKRVEARLEAEIAQRGSVEQHLREIANTYHRQIESLELESLTRIEIEEALAGVETRLHQETILREEAENELNLVRARAGRDAHGSQDTKVYQQQLLDRIKMERQARLHAERAREAAEANARAAQTRLSEAAREFARAEAHYEELLLRQQIELRELQLQLVGDTTPRLELSTNLAPVPPPSESPEAPFSFNDPAPPLSACQEQQHKNQIIWYGLAILVLLMILILLSFAVYKEL
jgi:hypothetical protein